MANKSKLNEFIHKLNLQLPVYNTLPQGDGFICKLKLGEQTFVSENTHSRKKAAEDDAAAVAVSHLTNENSTNAELSQPSTSIDNLSTRQDQINTSEILSLTPRSSTIDSNRTQHVKEIPLNMFYPTSQQSTEKPSEELQDFCSSRGWTEPIYHLKVKNKESTCGVFVNKVLYSFNDTHPTDEEAKQEAAKQVLTILSAKPASQLEEKPKGITIVIPKKSHPATAKLVKTHPVASVDDITSSIAKLTTSSEMAAADAKTTAKQLTTSSAADTKPTAKQLTASATADSETNSSEVNAKPTDKQPTTSSGADTDDSTDVKHSQSGGSDKNTLQHLCQKNRLIPEYKTEYPPNEVGYITKLTVDDKTFSSGVHGSKKAAEAAAAREAIKYLTSAYPESNKTANSTMPKAPGTYSVFIVYGFLEQYTVL